MYQFFNQVVFSVEARTDEQSDKSAHYDKKRVEEPEYQDCNARHRAEHKADFPRAVTFKAVNKKFFDGVEYIF